MSDTNKPIDLFKIPLGSTQGNTAIKQHQVENSNDVDLLAGLDQEQVRARHQGVGSELLNGTSRALAKVVPNIISNIASISDVEDYYNQDNEVGNSVSRFVQETINPAIDAALPIYRENAGKSLDVGSSDWWTSNMTSVLGSGLEFAITGAGVAGALGKGLSLVGATGKVGQALNIGANALALNQAEAIISAQEVYKNAYELNMRKPLMTEERAKQIAADAAAYTININRLNIPLNLSSAALFTKTPKMTRQLLANKGRKEILAELGREGTQEYGEETINMIGEHEGARRGAGQSYSGMNTIRDVFSAEGLEAGTLGFLGGISQTGFTEGINEFNGKNKEERAAYQAQQASLDEIDKLRTTVTGQQNLKEIIESAHVQSSLQNQIVEADAANQDDVAIAKRNQLLQFQAVSAFDNGTTDKLIEAFKEYKNNPEVLAANPEAGIKANEAIAKVEAWEKLYNNIAEQVDRTRVNATFNNAVEKQNLITQHQELTNKENHLTAQIAANDLLSIPSPQEVKQLENIKAQKQANLNSLLKNSEDYAHINSEEFNPESYKQSKIQSITGEVSEPVVAEEDVVSEEELVDSEEEFADNTYADTMDAEEIAGRNSGMDTADETYDNEGNLISEKKVTNPTQNLKYTEKQPIKQTKQKLSNREEVILPKNKYAQELIANYGILNDPGFVSKLSKEHKEALQNHRAEIIAAGQAQTNNTKRDELEQAIATSNGKSPAIPSSINDAWLDDNSKAKLTIAGDYALSSSKPNSKNEYRFRDTKTNERLDLPLSYVKSIDVFGYEVYSNTPTPPTGGKPPIDDEDSNDSTGGITLLKTSATDSETREKENKKDRIRWNNFVDNFKGDINDYVFKVVVRGDELYEELESPSYLAEMKKKNQKPEDGIFLVWSDKNGNPIDAEGNPADDRATMLWTSPVKNFKNTKDFAVNPKHYSKVHGLEYKSGDENNEKSEFRQHFENEIARHKVWRDSLLDGTYKFLRPEFISPGAVMWSDEHGSPLGRLFTDVDNPAKDGVELIIKTKAHLDEQGNSLGYALHSYYPLGSDKLIDKHLKLGILYVKKNGVFYELEGRPLNDSEQKIVTGLFSKLTDSKQHTNILKELKKYVYVTDNGGAQNKGSINPKLHFDVNTNTIHFDGNKSINASKAKTSPEFLAFVETLYRNADNSALKEGDSDSKGSKGSVPKINANGFIDNKGKRISYNEFLFGGDEPAFTTNFPTLDKQQHENSYFGFSENSLLTDLIGEAPVQKEKIEGEKEEVPVISEKPKVKKRAEKSIEPLKRIADKKNYYAEDIAAAKKFYKDRFSDNDLIITKELIDGDAFGQFYNDITYLYNRAEKGTIYHESYHKVEEQYLTPKQVEALHKELEKFLGREIGIVEGKELRAEAFREYVLNGQKPVKGMPVRNTFFRRLYNYIKSLVTGEVSIEQVFKKLASKEGYKNAAKVRSFKGKLNSIANRTSKEAREVNGALSIALFDFLFKNDITPTSLLDSDKSVVEHNVAVAYDTIENNYIRKSNLLADKIEDETATAQDIETYEKLDAILENFEEIKEAHKKSIRALIKLTPSEEKTEETKTEDVPEDDSNEIDTTNDDAEKVTEKPETESADRNDQYNKKASEVNPVTTISNNTKMLIGTLKQMEYNPKTKAYTPVLNFFGEPITVEGGYAKTYTTISSKLSGALTIENTISKLNELAPTYPYVQDLITKLGNPETIATTMPKAKVKVWQDFMKDMNKYDSKGTQTVWYPESGNIGQVNANDANLKNQLRDGWKNAAFLTKNRITVDGKEQFKPSVIGLQGQAFLDGVGIDLGRKLNIKGDLTTEELEQVVNAIESIKLGLKDNPHVSDLFSEADSGTAVNTLLDIAAKYSTKYTSTTYKDAAGKTNFGLSNHDYITKITSEINNAKNLDELYETCPFLNSVSTQGSITLKSLFDSKGNKRKDSKGNYVTLSVPTYAGLNESGKTGTVTTKLDSVDKVWEEINSLLLAGQIAIPRTSDKATEKASVLSSYLLSNGKDSMIPVPISEVTEDFNSKEIKTIFEGYFVAEFNRIRSRRINDLGADIEIYGVDKFKEDEKGNPIRDENDIFITIPHSSNAANWTIFQDILSEKTKKAFIPYLNNNMEDPTSAMMKEVHKDIQRYLNELNSENAELLHRIGIGEELEEETKDVYKNGKKDGTKIVRAAGILGISNSLSSKYDMDTITRAFTVNQFIKAIEDHKVFLGDKAFFKDPFKRYSAFTGNKKFAITDKVFLDRINKDKQWGEYSVRDTVRTVVLQDISSRSKYMEQFKKALAHKYTDEQVEKIYEDYGKMTEADAQGLSNLVFYKHFKELCSEWTDKEEKQYNYEMAYEIVSLSEKGKKYPKKLVTKAKETLAKGNPGYVLMPIKPQYAGAQATESTKGLFAPTFHKYSISPMFYRLVEGTNLEAKYLDMVENEVGYMVFSSGVKLGALVDKANEMPKFYDSEGQPTLIEEGVTPIQEIYYKYLGIQVDIAPKAKEKVIYPTQMRKLFMANSFEFGAATDASTAALHKEFKEIIDSMITDAWEKLVIDLGFEKNKDKRSYKQANVEKLVALLKSEGEDRELANNLIDSLQTKDGKLKYSIDILVNKDKLESMLFSIVNNRVIKQTMPGDGMVQRAITGSESGVRMTSDVNSKGEPLYTSNDLEFYRLGEDGNILPMQIKVPLTAQFAELIKAVPDYENKSSAQILMELNAMIKVGHPNIDKRVLLSVGCRIPVQGLNSIESMEIVEFLADAAGNTIILPTEIVAKSGGDFDIDKLNIFRANFKVKNGKVVYTNSDKKNLINASRQNRLIELNAQMIQKSYNYEQLTTPNTVAKLKEIVGKIRENKGISQAKKSFTKELTFSHILDQFKYFLGGKQGVGVAAVHNTFHTLFQESNTTLKPNYLKLDVTTDELVETPVVVNFEVHRDNNKNILLGGKLDKGKNLISDTISQFINAYVDVAKDPFYKDLNAGMDAVGVIFFLIHTGADIETIIGFMNQPAIVDLLNAEADNNSFAAKIKGQKEKREIFEEIKQKYAPNKPSKQVIELGSKDNTQLYDWMRSGKKDDKFLQAQSQFLEDFQNYRKYGNDLTQFTQTLNSDTSKVGSYADGDNILQSIKEIKADKSIFSESERESLKRNTIVGSFDKLTQTRELFKSMFDKTQSIEAIESKEKLKSIVNPFKTSDKARLTKLIDNDYIGYITQRFYTNEYEGTLGQQISSLVHGDNSMSHRLAHLKTKIKDNYLLDQLQSLFTPEETQPNNISIYARRVDTAESNDLTLAYRELLNYQGDAETMEEVQDFANDLTSLGIVQSGLNNSPITYLGLIPYEKYTDIVEQAFNEYEEYDDEDKQTIQKDFQARFFMKNLGNPLVTPLGKDSGGEYQKNAVEMTDTKGKFTLFFKTNKGVQSSNKIPVMSNIQLERTGYRLQDFYLEQDNGWIEVDFKENAHNINESDEWIEDVKVEEEEIVNPKATTNSILYNATKARIHSQLLRGLSKDEILLNGSFTVSPQEVENIFNELTEENDSELGSDNRDLNDLYSVLKPKYPKMTTKWFKDAWKGYQVWEGDNVEAFRKDVEKQLKTCGF